MPGHQSFNDLAEALGWDATATLAFVLNFVEEKGLIVELAQALPPLEDDVPETTPWVESTEIPEGMTFVAHSPRKHYERLAANRWQLLLQDARSKLWTLYDGCWPDTPGLSWEDALERADEAMVRR
jgi:hypothetical protein